MLPIPTITQGNRKHAFIKLKAMIQHALIFIQRNDINQKYTKLIQSKSAKSLITKAQEIIVPPLQTTTLIVLVIA